MDKTQQQGMSLVSVLMLSTLAATVAFTALHTAVTQNRISGNFQKNLNAQQQAEQAVFDSFHRLNQYLRDNPNATAAELAAIAANDATNTVRNNHIESVQLLSNQLLLGGKGGYLHDSVSRQNAKLNFIPGSTGTPITPFEFALTGCDGVNLDGSGAIQSYDSTNASATDTRANVRTVNNNANLTLSGSSPINGDVIVRGNLNITRSASISGNVRANGDTLIKGASAIGGDVLIGGNLTIDGSSKISGNTRANGDIDINANATFDRDIHAMGGIVISNTPTIQGEIRANSHINLKNGVTIHNGIKTKGNLVVTNGVKVSKAVLVEGNISILAWIANGNYFQDKAQVFYAGSTQHNFGTLDPTLSVVAVEAVEPLPTNESDSAKEGYNQLCDPLKLPSLFQHATIPALSGNIFNVRQASNKRKYTFNGNTGLASFTDSVDTQFNLAAQPFNFGNESTPTFFLKGLDIASDAVVSVVGDVRLYLEQGMTLQNNAQFVITPGSRLTILTSGKIEIKNSGRFRTQEGGETAPQGLVQGKPVLAIYSNYQSQNANDIGILLSGASSGLYAAIYAPASHIKVTAGNSFAGSAVGKTLSVDGAGAIRYDQALSKISPVDNTGPGNKPPRIAFKGF